MNDRSQARHISPWSTRQKIGRVLWSIIAATLFGLSPRPMYRWRAWLLRLFGAKVDRTARIHPTVRIAIPWHLTVGAGSSIGDRAIVYSLGPITIGARVTVSQYAHLCAGTHDFDDEAMPLLRPPIFVEDDAWIAADAFVGPGVRVGAGAIVGARSSAFGDVPAWTICVGSPARPLRERKRPGSDSTSC